MKLLVCHMLARSLQNLFVCSGLRDCSKRKQLHFQHHLLLHLFHQKGSEAAAPAAGLELVGLPLSLARLLAGSRSKPSTSSWPYQLIGTETSCPEASQREGKQLAAAAPHVLPAAVGRRCIPCGSGLIYYQRNKIFLI